MINNYKFNLITITLISLLIIGLSSCKKEEGSLIGMNVIPDSDKIPLFVDTINVECYTQSIDSLAVDDKALSSIGSYIDPIFGFSKASLACQFKLSASKVNFSNVSKINSFELHLKLHSCYGDSLSSQNISIYKLLKDLDEKKVYYSNYRINSNDLELLTTTTISYNPNDSSRIIKLQLPIELAETFINPTNSNHFQSDSTFLSFFKGLYLTTENVSNGGGIFSFGLLDKNSKMIMYYNDSLNFSFTIDSKCAMVKVLEHDYTNASTDLVNALNNTSSLSNLAYIQGLGGLRTKLYLPELRSLIDSSKISINRAKLFINVDVSSSTGIFSPPPKLTLMKVSKSGNIVLITDQLINAKAFDGSYNSTTYEYTFNISLHIQELMKSDESASLFLVPLPARNQATPHRVVIHGNSDEIKRAKLEIYYSKY